MTNSDKKGVPTTATPSNSDAQKDTICACGRQHFPITRREFFAGCALAGIIAGAENRGEVLHRCIADDLGTVQQAFMISKVMDQRAALEGGVR